MSLFAWLLVSLIATHGQCAKDPWIKFGGTGFASMTHYDLPPGFVAACGCVGDSTKYPTAALSQFAYGSSESFGPVCGRCFELTLVRPVYATPPFTPPQKTSIVVKITDLCPFSKTGVCGGVPEKKNYVGSHLNFDLAWPSLAIPSDFFPSDVKTYGYTDFGIWNISYQAVSCQSWAGSNDSSALGAVGSVQQGVCCPANLGPLDLSSKCSSYSDEHGISPYHTSDAPQRFPRTPLLISTALCVLLLALR